MVCRKQPGLPKQTGQQLQTPPALQRQPNAPGVLRPGLQNRPLLQPRRPVTPAPKGKPKKEKQ